MVTLFPIIGVNLKSEDIDTRKQVINFLGRIFASDVPAPAQAQAQANVTIELSSNSSNNSNVNIISSTSLSSPTTSASTTTAEPRTSPHTRAAVRVAAVCMENLPGVALEPLASEIPASELSAVVNSPNKITELAPASASLL